MQRGDERRRLPRQTARTDSSRDGSAGRRTPVPADTRCSSMVMCSALASRTEPSRRSACGHIGSSLAEVRESPLANSVTSWPSATSSSVSQEMTRSVPPYSFGGIASVRGAICAMRMKEPVSPVRLACGHSGQHAKPEVPASHPLTKIGTRGSAGNRLQGSCVAVRRATLRHLLQDVTIGESGSIVSRSYARAQGISRDGRRSLPLRRSPDRIPAPLRAAAPVVPCGDSRSRCSPRSAAAVSTQYGVKFLVDTLAGHAPATASGSPSLFLVSLDRRRQSAVAGGQLDRELHLPRRHRGPAPRSVPPPDRPCAELFRRPAARHADQPHHRDLERRLHHREHVHVERAAALRGDGRRDRLRPDRERADGRRA